jgi:hypothetical protein
MSNKQEGMQVHSPDSLSGQLTLTLEKVSAEKLEEALVKYQQVENVKIGTKLGINDKGFFFSDDPQWHPEKPNAFKKKFGFIPWVYIHELLGDVPEGTTGKRLGL